MALGMLFHCICGLREVRTGWWRTGPGAPCSLLPRGSPYLDAYMKLLRVNSTSTESHETSEDTYRAETLPRQNCRYHFSSHAGTTSKSARMCSVKRKSVVSMGCQGM